MSVMESTEVGELKDQLQKLEQQVAVQEATMAGQMATNTAVQAGTWSTMVAGGIALAAGMALGLLVSIARR